ncbi:bifunctional metallophosphatase/5'-nucleotidase [Chitinophagaceae bacterium LWZ2-11]
MQIDRRRFVKQAGGASIGLLMSSLGVNDFAGSKEPDKLTILHTNDLHGKLERFPQDAGYNAERGGIAGLSGLIAQIRNEIDHCLLFDAGDIFGRTPCFEMYKGEPEIKAMSLMGYDACTIGESDLSAGFENLANQLKYANFPVINANYDFEGTAMQNKIMPYKIFERGNRKVGVTGVGIDLKNLIPDNIYSNKMYKDPIQNANIQATYLRKQGCDLIICLSHLGDKYDDGRICDEILAKESYEIDLIIGGHTHKFFDKPTTYKNKKGNDTSITQAGWGGLQLGRLDYSFSRSRNKNLWQSHTVVLRKKTKE